jgi:hypothetical protein
MSNQYADTPTDILMSMFLFLTEMGIKFTIDDPLVKEIQERG